MNVKLSTALLLIYDGLEISRWLDVLDSWAFSVLTWFLIVFLSTSVLSL